MGEFRIFADRVNEMTSKVFTQYQAAKDQLDEAKAALEAAPRDNSWQSKEKYTKAARIHDEAKEVFYSARRKLQDVNNEFPAIRKELVEAVNRSFTVDPAEVDAATVTLLDSGILGAADYEKLMDSAEKADNLTMIRLISAKAAEAEKKVSYAGNDMSPDAVKLRAVANKAATYTTKAGKDIVDGFDVVTDVYRRCAKTPEMISHWDELAGAILQDY